MRRVATSVAAGAVVILSTLALWVVGRADLALGLLACVAFVLGLKNLADVLREALPQHPSALMMLAMVSAGMLAVAVASPEVWPLFVVGYPSCASVVMEAWLRLRGVIANASEARNRG